VQHLSSNIPLGYCQRAAESCASDTLQHTATHCNIPQHITTHCGILQHTATYCTHGWQIGAHCNTMQHTSTHCNTPVKYCWRATGSSSSGARVTLQQPATHYNTLQHNAAHCIALHYTAPHRTTLQHTAAHCNTLLQTSKLLPESDWQLCQRTPHPPRAATPLQFFERVLRLQAHLRFHLDYLLRYYARLLHLLCVTWMKCSFNWVKWLFKCVTWLLDRHDSSNVWHDSFNWVTRLFNCVTRPPHLCDLFPTPLWPHAITMCPFSCVWHASFNCVTWPLPMCNMSCTHSSLSTCSYTMRPSPTSCVLKGSFRCVTWRIPICDMSQWDVSHVSMRCVTWHLYICIYIHVYVYIYMNTYI